MEPMALVLIGSVVLASAGCFTATGAVVGSMLPGYKPTTPQALEAVKPGGEVVEVQLVAFWPPARTLPGAYELEGVVTHDDGDALFVRNEAGTWRVPHSSIEIIEAWTPSGWATAWPASVTDWTKVRMRLLHARARAESRSEYRLAGEVVGRPPGELVITNRRGTWHVYDEDVKALYVKADTRWKEGLVRGVERDAWQFMYHVVLVKPRP